MGMQVFTKSGKFDPKAFGLKVGQALQIIAMGGGGGGGNCGRIAIYNKQNVSYSNFHSLLGAGSTTCTNATYVFIGSAGNGGTSGELVVATVPIESLDEIDVVVGAGGTIGNSGEQSVFGNNIFARGGNPGNPGTTFQTTGTVSNSNFPTSLETEAPTKYNYVYKNGFHGENGTVYKPSTIDNTTIKAKSGGNGGGGWKIYDGYKLYHNDNTIEDEDLTGFGQGGKGIDSYNVVITSSSNNGITTNTFTATGGPNVLGYGKDGVVIVTW